MKKLILLLSFATPLGSYAQSTTILPDALSVPRVTALSTCNSIEKGKQVLNTTDNKMYYCYQKTIYHTGTRSFLIVGPE